MSGTETGASAAPAPHGDLGHGGDSPASGCEGPNESSSERPGLLSEIFAEQRQQFGAVGGPQLLADVGDVMLDGFR